MNFKMTPIIDKTIESCFIVSIDYEHGDADLTTSDNTIIKSTNLSDLEKFIDKFNEVNIHVDNNRSYGTKYPPQFEELDYCFPVPGLYGERTCVYIPLERDQFTNDSNYFAGMSIGKVIYYDESGQKFNVTWSK